MKELTANEMNEVSGAGIKDIIDGKQNLLTGIFDAIVGGIIGLTTTAAAGALQGGLTSQGATAGLLGVGNISLLVSTTWGLIQGGLMGGIYGAYNGSAWSEAQALGFVNSVLNGTGGGYKPNSPSYI